VNTARVIIYVDGFNLFYGLKTAYGRQYHWLDLEQLARELLIPGQSLAAIKYFTARVRNDPLAEQRQDSYLQALQAHCSNVQVVEGRFQRKSNRCRSCGIQWVTSEEKESDVSLAVNLVGDAALGLYDTALVISADSDLCPAVRSAKRLRPKAAVVAVFPPNRRADPLRVAADAVYFLAADKLSRAQLPTKIVTPAGIELNRPEHWS
jgi:uncharacterized LabA/DUF88 family protein